MKTRRSHIQQRRHQHNGLQRSLGAPKRERKDALAEGFRQLKLEVHNRLFETLDVAQAREPRPGARFGQGHRRDQRYCSTRGGRLLTDSDRARLVEEIKNELLGLGPLEPLLRDDADHRHPGQRPRPRLRREAAASCTGPTSPSRTIST